MSMRDAISVLTEVNEIIDARIKAVADSRPESEGYAAELARCVTDYEIRRLRLLKDDIGKIKPNNWPTRGLLRRCINKAVIRACWGLMNGEAGYQTFTPTGEPINDDHVAPLYQAIMDTREYLVEEGFDAESVQRWLELDSAIIKELRAHSAVSAVVRYERGPESKTRSGLVDFYAVRVGEFAKMRKRQAAKSVS